MDSADQFELGPPTTGAGKRVLSRRELLARGSTLGLALAGAGLAPGVAAGRLQKWTRPWGGPPKYTWQSGITGATNNPGYISFYWFTQRVAKYTDGAVSINIFPNGQFGGDAQNYAALKSGQFQTNIIDASVIFSDVPTATLFQLPYIYANPTTARKVYTNPKFTTKPNAGLEAQGIHVLEWHSLGPRDLGGKKFFKEPGDLSGVKIRVIPSELFTTLFSTLGAVPTPLAPAEVYAALQQGVVDAYDQPVAGTLSFKWYEPGPYITLSHHVYSVGFLGINKQLWETLPANIQAGIQRAATEYSVYNDNLITSANQQALGELKAAGAKISNADLGAYRKAAAPVWYHFADRIGGIDVIRSAITAQGHIRANVPAKPKSKKK